MKQSSESMAYFASASLQHLDALYGYALTLTRNPAAAEDLVQETYLRAVRAAGEQSAHSNLKGWLFVILRNAWLNILRHERKAPWQFELESEECAAEWIDDSAPDPYVLYLRKLERQEIRNAINSLPTLQREIVVLRDIEGFTYHEIATLLGCPAGTVMSRLGRARKKLRQVLAAKHNERASQAL